MITTERFIYIHLHKSGGTFINECLMRFFPDARQVGYHLPCRLIPKALRGMPVLGFVRSPWSYYVSWYSFQSRMARGNVLYRCLSEDGKLDFRATVRNMLDLGSGSPKLDELLGQLSEAYTTQGFNIPRPALEPIRKTGMGFYSYLYQYMYGGHNGMLYLGRTENLREDFLGYLKQLNVPVSDELRTFVEVESARNASVHEPYTSYYDDELRDLVAQRDESVIRAFGYRFGD